MSLTEMVKLLYSFIHLHFSFHVVIFRNKEFANIPTYECLMRVAISIGVMEMSVTLEKKKETNEERPSLWKIIFSVLHFLNQKCLLEAERIKLHGI